MATKNNPGKYNCYANAEPDEPMFVLLGRDKHAPTLIWLWAVLRELDQEDAAKVKEARECAVAMIEWLSSKGKQAVGVGQSAMAALLELIRMANYAFDNAKNQKTEDDVDLMRKFFCVTKFEDS